jgi:hypothetical protein
VVVPSQDAVGMGEEGAGEVVGGLTVEVPAELAELLVVELDDMEAVQDDCRLGEILFHGLLVGGGEVDGDGLDLGFGRCQPPPERIERSGLFPLSGEENRAAVEVQHQGQEAIAAADADLIDADVPHVLERWFGEVLLQVTFVDVLDDVPTHPPMLRHVLHRHPPAEFQDIPLEHMSVRAAGVGQPDVDLPDNPAGPALDAGERGHDPSAIPPDRQVANPAVFLASQDHVAAPALGATHSMRLRLAIKQQPLLIPLRLRDPVAMNAQNLIQSLLGHVGAPREGLVTQTLRKPHVPSFFYHPARASVRRAQKSIQK